MSDDEVDGTVGGTELVFGLVGAVGTDLATVQKALEQSLATVNYDCEEVRVSRLLHDVKDLHGVDLPDDGPEDERIQFHMDAGDKVRRSLGRGDSLAVLAMLALRDSRQQASGDPNIAAPGKAYVLNSLKHPREVSTLRDIYGAAFVLLSAYSPRDDRIEKLARRIADTHGDTNIDRYRDRAEKLAYRDEQGGGDEYGQDVRDTFPLADVFVDASEEEQLASAVERVVQMIFAHPFHTPTRDEYGMFVAQAARLRSADLSRQVGAAVAAQDGDIVALGTNEVPKAGGGL